MGLKSIDIAQLTVQEEVTRVCYFLHMQAPKVSIVFPYTLPIADAMYIQKNDTIYVDYQTLQMQPLEIVLMYVIKAVRTKYQLAQYDAYFTDTRYLYESPSVVDQWAKHYKYYTDSKNPESFEKYIKSDAHVDCQAFSIFMFDVLHEQSLRIPSLNKIRVMRKIREFIERDYEYGF